MLVQCWFNVGAMLVQCWFAGMTPAVGDVDGTPPFAPQHVNFQPHLLFMPWFRLPGVFTMQTPVEYVQCCFKLMQVCGTITMVRRRRICRPVYHRVCIVRANQLHARGITPVPQQREGRSLTNYKSKWRNIWIRDVFCYGTCSVSNLG